MLTRPSITVSAAATITLALLISMTALIDQGLAAPIDTPRVMLLAPATPAPPPEPEQPAKPVRPPPPAIPPIARNHTTGVTVSPKPTEIGLPGSAGPSIPTSTVSQTIVVTRSDDGPAIEVMAVQPTYPLRMLSRNLEGSVIVSFSVNAAGRVVDAAVVSSTHGGFERAALDAIERFRYRPRVVDGMPVPTHALQKQFTFNVER